MARIRSLKPEIASDAKLAKASIQARYTFVLMITQADDAGLIAAAHRQLLGTLYPLDDAVTVPSLLMWVEELVNIGLVKWLSTRDGSPVLQLVNWAKHQRIDNASRSQLEALLPESSVDPLPSADARGSPPNFAASRGEPPLGSGTKDLGPSITDQSLSRDAVMRWTAALNRGLADHPKRPQPIPRIIASNGRTLEATEELLAAGVSVPFGESALYTLAKEHSAERPITSMKYFVAAVTELWKQEKERVAAASTPTPATIATTRGPLSSSIEQQIAALKDWEKKSA